MAKSVLVAFKNEQGVELGQVAVPAKDFKTGSKGYFTSGKIEVDGLRYQMQVQLVLIGSKPADLEDLAAKAAKQDAAALDAMAKAEATKAELARLMAETA
jgi:hypothetical protein